MNQQPTAPRFSSVDAQALPWLATHAMPSDQHVLWASHTDRQSTYVVRTDSTVLDPAWSVTPLGLEDLVLTYMEGPAVAAPAAPSLEVIR